jgi:hypothetical protein
LLLSAVINPLSAVKVLVVGSAGSKICWAVSATGNVVPLGLSATRVEAEP